MFIPDAGSRIRLFTIPDPGSELSPSRIPDPRKKPKKWFLSSRKYDPGFSSRIPDPDANFLHIPDPGSRGQKAPDPESRIRIRNTGEILRFQSNFAAAILFMFRSFVYFEKKSGQFSRKLHFLFQPYLGEVFDPAHQLRVVLQRVHRLGGVQCGRHLCLHTDLGSCHLCRIPFF